MKNWLLSLLTICFIPAFAQTGISSSIESVTVYRSGAIVQRQAHTNIPSGHSTLHFVELPNALNPNAIKVELPEGVRLLKKEYRSMTPSEMGYPSFEEIGKKIEAADDAITAERDKQTSLNEDLQFIGQNSDLRSGTSVEELKKADEYISSRRREIRANLRASINRLEELRAEAQALRAEFAELELQLDKTKSVLVAEINSPTVMNAQDIEIEYLMYNAKWTPYYNVRSTNLDEPILFEFNAAIQQYSGEDWEDVMITISTGNPSIGANEPNMNPWYISYNDYYVPTHRSSVGSPNLQQKGTFYALILDKSSGKPLMNTRVELTSGSEKIIATSDASGRIEVKVPHGTYTLQCSYIGYSDLSSSVTVDASPSLQRIQMNKDGTSSMVAVQFRQPEYRSQNYASNGRADADVVFIDGVRVRGAFNVPRAAIDHLEVVMGGTPAHYGDSPLNEVYEVGSTRSVSNAYQSPQGNSVQIRNFQRVSQTTATEYSLDEPYTVPSDGSVQDAWIQTAEAPAEFIFRMRPALSDKAFLVGQIAEWEQLELLNATAHFFVGGTYNGTGFINANETGDTLEIGLGNDPRVNISRERIDTRTSKKFFSSTITESFKYRISVRNNRGETIQVEIQEQFPISRHSDIEVEDRIAPNGVVDPTNQFITWSRSLETGQEIEVGYSFNVLYPSEMAGSINLPR